MAESSINSKHLRSLDEGETCDRPSKQISARSSRPGRLRHLDETELEERYELAQKWKEEEATREAACNALSPEEKRQKSINDQREWLVRHSQPHFEDWVVALSNSTKVRLLDDKHNVRFLFQLAPRSHRGASCKFRSCDTKIERGEYRIAVKPGNSHHWAKSPDYYHLFCFEHLIDFDSLYFLSRLTPCIKNRVDAGAIALFNTWKKECFAKIDNKSDEPPVTKFPLQISLADSAASPSDPAKMYHLEKENSLKADDLLTKIRDGKDLGQTVTEAEIARVLARASVDAFLEGPGAVDLTIKPKYRFDGFGPNGETLTKLVDEDQTWQILDYLKDEWNDEDNNSNSKDEVRNAQSAEAASIDQRQDPTHKLSRALEIWRIDQSLALDEDELSETGKEEKAPSRFSKSDVNRIEMFSAICVNTPFGLPFEVLELAWS